MTRYRVDTETSMIRFEADTTTHAITATAQVAGWFEADVSSGQLSADGMSGHLEVAVADIESGNRLLDRELRRRMDPRRFPQMSGDLEEALEVDGSRATVTGVVEVRSVEVLVEGTIVVHAVGDGLRLSGEGTFDIRWFGIDPPKLLVLEVKPEVDVSIDLALTPETGSERH